jgi:hypothetical protein
MSGGEGSGAIARAYGLLATSLNEAVGEARLALGAHGELVRSGLVDDLDTLLAEFARRRIRIAIYGEVKAGKSTLLNAIAGAILSPVAFDPLTSAPIRVTYGPQTRWRLGERTLDDVDELTGLMRAENPAVAEVVVETSLDLLQLGGQVDLIDTPGVGSEERFDAVSAATLRGLDAVVLVVRYPALFTQFTRHLMQALENEIGKLFVVWNVDADCADLTAQERAHHADTLRARVAGANELYLVDARAAYRAAQANDAAGRAASGIPAFIDGLARFAGSEKREVVALREAAKRTHEWLGDAQETMARECAALDGLLSAARERLDATRASFAEKVRHEETRLADLITRGGRIRDDHGSAVDKLAAALARDLRAAHVRWIRRGDYEALARSVSSATAKYADGVVANDRRALEQLLAVAREFGTRFAAEPRERSEPAVVPLVPSERVERAQQGRWRFIRRALWRRWYVPGVDQLQRTKLPAVLAEQKTWFDSAVRTAESAGRETLAQRLATLKSEEDSEIARIKEETGFDAMETKFAALSRDLPIVASQVSNVEQIATQARALLATRVEG